MGHKGDTYTVYVLYPYLINKRKSSIHVLDYELHIKVDKKYKKFNRIYSIENAKELKILDLDMSDFEKKLIYKKNEPFEYGVPSHGFVIFNAPPSLHGEKVQKYKLICIDALGNKHKIVTKETEFIDAFRLQELAQVELPMPPNPQKIRLKVIPEPAEGTASVFTKGDSDNRDPFMKSESGSYDLVCGSCEFPITIKMESPHLPHQLKDIVFHCPECNKYNVSNTPAAI